MHLEILWVLKQKHDRFACKRISKEKLRTEIDVEDVRREVEIMSCLPKHPNIVTFKEAFEDEDAVYLVMEICEGGELFDRIVARGHYTERAAASVTKTILEVVKVWNQESLKSLLFFLSTSLKSLCIVCFVPALMFTCVWRYVMNMEWFIEILNLRTSSFQMEPRLHNSKLLTLVSPLISNTVLITSL